MGGELRSLMLAQHGVASRKQLLAAGLSARTIEGRLRAGRLHSVHRGVYSIGRPDLGDAGLWLAGVLAAGDDAVLSHRSAAALWGIRPWPARLAEVSSAGGVRRPKIISHRSNVPAAERTLIKGIPVTTISRTVLDLAEVLPKVELDEAVHQTYRLGRWDADEIDRIIRSHPGRNAASRLRVVIAETTPGKGFVRSKLERWLRQLCRRYGLPSPESNQHVLGLEVDFLWREQMLVVEADGRGSHLTPQAFERDHKRDRKLRLGGYGLLRFTHREITETPELVAADVLRGLGASAPGLGLT